MTCDPVGMPSRRTILAALVAARGGALHAAPAPARRPRDVATPAPLRFPRDFGAHPRARTEWWYVTGALAAGDTRVGLPDHLLSRRDRLSPATTRAASRRASCCSRTARSPTSRRDDCATTSASRAAASAIAEAADRDTALVLRDWRLARSGGAGAQPLRRARGERQRRLRLRPRARGDAAGRCCKATAASRARARGPSRRAATTASRSSRCAARSRSTVDRPRSPAAPGSTTNGATPTSTRAPSAGTGSA